MYYSIQQFFSSYSILDKFNVLNCSYVQCSKVLAIYYHNIDYVEISIPKLNDCMASVFPGA